ncbi:MAG: hypothetical protein GY804_11465 [Alphaproteobacteria bacterium]|nr:hypothetical protein [Alphaproteobacteria bacterium]
MNKSEIEQLRKENVRLRRALIITTNMMNKIVPSTEEQVANFLDVKWHANIYNTHRGREWQRSIKNILMRNITMLKKTRRVLQEEYRTLNS